MQHKTSTIVALAITAAWPSMSFAEDSVLVGMCAAYVDKGRVDVQAEYVCEQAAKEGEDEGKLYYADFLFLKEDRDGAIKIYSGILEGADLEKPTESELTALRLRAMAWLHDGQPSADDDVRAALKIKPDDADLLREAAQFSNTPEQKLEYADRLIAVDPKSVAAHELRSVALTDNKRFQEALSAADTAFKLDPKSPLPEYARAYAHGWMGEFATAEKEFAAVVRMVPNEPLPKVLRAGVLMQLKRDDEAIELLTEALKLDPKYAEAQQMLADARARVERAKGAAADGK